MNYRETILNSKKYQKCEPIASSQVRWMFPNEERAAFHSSTATRTLCDLESEGLLEKVSGDKWIRPNPLREFLRNSWRSHENCEEVTACWHAHRR